MIGGATKRDRQVERAEARIYEIEQRRIFEREQAGEPGIAAVSNDKPRLEAGEGPIMGEPRGGKPELTRRRKVLRVIDDE